MNKIEQIEYRILELKHDLSQLKAMSHQIHIGNRNVNKSMKWLQDNIESLEQELKDLTNE